MSTGAPWWLLAISVVVIDQALKLTVQAWLPYREFVAVTSFFNLTHVGNPGAAFSLLADAGGWQRYFFIALGTLVAVWLAILLGRPLPRIEAFGYSFILGGALGNVVDRVIRGHVVDYLDFYWRDWHWPAFNAADVSITTGAALLIASSLRSPKTQPTT
ncbi:MAG: signal peptidase II [Burkholderiales bacterium]